jgi:hypothetical protein
MACPSSDGNYNKFLLINNFKTTSFNKKDFTKLEQENKKSKQNMIYKKYKIEEEIKKTKTKLKLLEKEKINLNKKFELEKISNFKKIFYDKVNV